MIMIVLTGCLGQRRSKRHMIYSSHHSGGKIAVLCIYMLCKASSKFWVLDKLLIHCQNVFAKYYSC